MVCIRELRALTHIWIISGFVGGYLSAQTAPGGAIKPAAVLQFGHRRAVTALAFSPDGHWLASGSKDNTIKIWDIATGRLLRTLYGHGAPVNTLAVSEDGKIIASGSGKRY